MSHEIYSEIINSTGRQFEINESPVKCCENPVYENADEPASLELSKLAQGSNRALFALVIIACLISLVALLLTILSLVGKTGSANEGQCTG